MRKKRWPKSEKGFLYSCNYKKGTGEKKFKLLRNEKCNKEIKVYVRSSTDKNHTFTEVTSDVEDVFQQFSQNSEDKNKEKKLTRKKKIHMKGKEQKFNL